MAEERYRLIHGDCLEVLRTLPDASVDCVITDPPYPCIKRSYGVWTVPEWEAMMHAAVREFRRVLKPSGSAVMVLQPNSEKVGRMRPWLFDFISWCCREWNVVQDAWWWNNAAVPNGGANSLGMMRASVKACIWTGHEGCYRNQDAVLWSESQHHVGATATERFNSASKRYPSGNQMNRSRVFEAAIRRGGVTPFNLLPIPNQHSADNGGLYGHGAATPLALCSWWTRYLCPPGGVVLDPFCGSGTVGIAALNHGASFVGIERIPEYVAIAEKRLAAVEPLLPVESARGVV